VDTSRWVRARKKRTPLGYECKFANGRGAAACRAQCCVAVRAQAASSQANSHCGFSTTIDVSIPAAVALLLQLIAWLLKVGVHDDVLMRQLRVDGRLRSDAGVSEAGLATRGRHRVLRATSPPRDPSSLHAHAAFVQHEHRVIGADIHRRQRWRSSQGAAKTDIAGWSMPGWSGAVARIRTL